MKQMSLNLFGPTYYGGFNPFLNWWKLSGLFGVQTSGGSNVTGQAAIDAGYLTPDGELVSPVPAGVAKHFKIIYVPSGNPGEVPTGEQFTVTWSGTTSNVSVSVAGSGAVPPSPANSSPSTFSLGVNPGAIAVFFDVTPGSTTPPTNINVYQTRYASAVAAGKKFNPDWVAEVQKFNPLRWLIVNESPLINYSEFATESFHSWTNQAADQGGKFHTPLSLWTALAAETGSDVWFCIPHKATTACVTSIATYFRDNLPAGRKIWFEYSNETWNYGFSQAPYCDAQAASKGVANGRQFAGYRASEFMKIIRDVFGDRTRWRGVLATQSVQSAISTDLIVGFNAWKTATSSSLNVSDLFDELAVTGYFGDTVPAWQVTSLTKGTTTTFVAAGSSGNFAVNDVLVFGRSGTTNGMPLLDGAYGTVTAVTGDTITVSLNTSTFGSWVNDGSTYITYGKLFKLMDQSETLNIGGDPKAYFSQQYAQMCRTSTCAFGAAIGRHGALDYMDRKDPQTGNASTALSFWGRQKTVADQYGLALTWYEGGLHFCPGGFAYYLLSANRGNNVLGDRLAAYIVATGHSAEMASVYEESYWRFLLFGGVRPTKFVEGGITTIFGPWAGIRYWKFGANTTDDTGNPIWQAVTRASAGIARFKLS